MNREKIKKMSGFSYSLTVFMMLLTHYQHIINILKTYTNIGIKSVSQEKNLYLLRYCSTVDIIFP